MRIALLLAVLSGLLSAQYQNYPKFYTTPSQTWVIDQVDSTKFVADLSREMDGIIRYHFYLSNQSDSLRHVAYLFVNNRLQQRKFIFSYRGDLETIFNIANQHNAELLWKYIKNSQTSNPADSGKIKSRFKKDQILSDLKKGIPYTNLFGYSDGDMIKFNIWYDPTENGLVAEMTFISKEFIGKDGD